MQYAAGSTHVPSHVSKIPRSAAQHKHDSADTIYTYLAYSVPESSLVISPIRNLSIITPLLLLSLPLRYRHRLATACSEPI